MRIITTPAAELEKAIPAANAEIDLIIETFVTPHYSRREIELKGVNVVKSAWDRIRCTLQDKAKRDRSAN